MLAIELFCICGLLATLQNVTVAMHNPHQGATTSGLSNERKSGEHDDGWTQNSGGSVGGVSGGPVGGMMSSNNSSHGMPHGVPTDTQLAQSSHLQASQYGFVGVQQPPQQGLNSSPMSNSQFSGLSQQHYVTQQSMPQPGGVQMPTNIDLIMRLMNEYPDNPFNIQMFAFAQQQPCNPFVGQFIQMAYDQFKFQMVQQMIHNQMQQTPSSKNIGTVSSKTGIPSPKNVNEPPTIIFQSYYLMNERVTYPISSKQYNEFLLMPYVLEARVHMDLERKRLPFYYLRKDQYDKLLVDNVKVNIDYEILVRKISYIKLDDNDQWAKHLHFLQGEWIGKRKTNADSPYWKQLITASALNRSALLYMSLHNATFGQANTDFDALNEIMVTLTNDERDKMCEVYSTEYNLLKRLPRDALCTALQNKESKQKKSVGNYYGAFIDGLCRNKRDEKFYIEENSYLLAQEEAEILKDFIDKSDKTVEFERFCIENMRSVATKPKKQVILDLFTKSNYEKMRYIFTLYEKLYQCDVLKVVNEKIRDINKLSQQSTFKFFGNNSLERMENMMSLVRLILIDVIHGRPYLMALLLREKLDRIYLAHLNKKKEELQDAFNDVTRIFLLRAPVDLVDISDEYGDEHGLYQKKLDPTTKSGKKIMHDIANKHITVEDPLEDHLTVINKSLVLAQTERKTNYENEREAIIEYIQLLKWLRKSNPKKVISRVMVTSDGKVSTMAAELEKAGQQFQQLISYAANAAGPYGNPAFAYGSDQQQQNQTKMHGDTMQSPQADIQQFQLGSFNQQSHNNPSAPPMYQQLNYDPNQEQQQFSYAENAADPYGNPAFAYGSDQQQQNMFMPKQAGMQGYTMQPPQADFEQFQHGSFTQQSHTNASAPPLYPQLDYDPNQELINYSDITNQMSDMSLRP